MEKNYQLTDNDLDLFDLLKIIWNEKLKIFCNIGFNHICSQLLPI